MGTFNPSVFSNESYKNFIKKFNVTPQALMESKYQKVEEAVPFQKAPSFKLKETDIRINEMDSELGISEGTLNEVKPENLVVGKEYVYTGLAPGDKENVKMFYKGIAKDKSGKPYHLFSDDKGTSGVFMDPDISTRFKEPSEIMRGDFNSFKNSLNEMASAYKIKSDIDVSKAKKVLAKAAEKVKSKSLKDALEMLSTKGEVDFKVWAKSQGKDVATWNNPSNRKVLDVELKDYVEPVKSSKTTEKEPVKKTVEKPTKKTTEKPVAKIPSPKKPVEKKSVQKPTSISNDEKTEKAEDIIKKHASKVKEGTVKKADLKLTWNQWVKKQGFDQDTLEYFQEKWNEKVK